MVSTLALGPFGSVGAVKRGGVGRGGGGLAGLELDDADTWITGTGRGLFGGSGLLGGRGLLRDLVGDRRGGLLKWKVKESSEHPIIYHLSICVSLSVHYIANIFTLVFQEVRYYHL